MEKEKVMVKLNVSIDEKVREELFRLVPPRRRSQVVNEALRKELLSRKRQHATEAIRRLRKRGLREVVWVILDHFRSPVTGTSVS